MPYIRHHYFFPPRMWRIAALRCRSTARRFTLRDPDQLVQRRLPAHSVLYLVSALNGDEIVPDSEFYDRIALPVGEPRIFRRCAVFL